MRKKRADVTSVKVLASKFLVVMEELIKHCWGNFGRTHCTNTGTTVIITSLLQKVRSITN